MAATNDNDAIWSFGLEKGKIYKRETNGKTYIVSVKERAFKPLDVKSPEFEKYRQKFVTERGSTEFMEYMKGLDKKWAKKIEYSPYILKDMRGVKDAAL